MGNQYIKQLKDKTNNTEYWAGLVDFTYLSKDYDIPGVLEFFDAAIRYKVRGICSWLDVFALKNTNNLVAKKIAAVQNKGILLIGVVNFPDGNGGIDLVKKEVKKAKDLGLDEVDMVLNAEAFNGGQYKIIEKEIGAVTDLFPKKTKLIIETGAVEERDFEKAVELASSGNISFVKTSTGFNHNIDFNDKLKHVKILADIIKKNNYDLKIKMSGGIRTLEQLRIAKISGADIFGISYGSAVDILDNL